MSTTVREPGERARVAAALVAHGAPLVVPDMPLESTSLSRTLAEALELAHHDATVLRVLPVVLLRNRDALDFEELRTQAAELGVSAELGMLLDLAGQLARDGRLQREAELLLPARSQQVQHFFANPNRYEARLAELRTPEVVRKWGFLMNMTEESLRSVVEKHVG